MAPFGPLYFGRKTPRSPEKRPDRLSFNAQGLAGGLPAMFFEEVKRTEGSHDEKNHRRSPHSTRTGDDREESRPGSSLLFN
jgi:hypothetical protein